MPTKRARHTGNIQKRGNAWRIRYWLAPDTNGERKQASETVRGTKKEAEGVLRERITTVENGGYVPRTNQTVAEFIDRWMNTYAATNTSLRTQLGYRHYVRRHINPALGAIQLQKLTTSQIQELYASMLDKG